MNIFMRVKKSLSVSKTKKTNFPDWDAILSLESAEWQFAKTKSQNGLRILIVSTAGAHRALAPVENALSVALTLRGADVHFLMCDEFLPTCWKALRTQFSDIADFCDSGLKQWKCQKCYLRGKKLRRPLGLPIHVFSEQVTAAEQKSADDISRTISAELIPGYREGGLALGEHSLAGALRFFARGSLDGEKFAEQVLRRYFKAALLTHLAIQRLFQTIHFGCAVFYHGIYVPEGIVGEVARRNHIRVVNWLTAYRKRTFIFSHTDTYHHTMMAEPVEAWENLPWSETLESRLMTYLKSRWRGTEDWISFVHKNPQVELPAEFLPGIDFSKPCIGLLTNVVWDAQLHYPTNAFPNMLDWVMRTIEYFSRRSDLQLLIRVHPAEMSGDIPSRQPVIPEITQRFPTLPRNVFIIPPESSLSTYAAMLKCDSVIIYGTKTGVELTSLGIPVIVAGEAWIRNKGITLDASSIKDYFGILDRLPLATRLDEALTMRARKYAFHYFFRRMIPLSFIDLIDEWPFYKLTLQTLDPLKPGNDRGLDIICDGILKGNPFIFPAEQEAD